MNPGVELEYSVQGTSIPVDHAYALYSAISRHIPDAHQNVNLSIIGIRGIIGHDRILQLTDHSCLTLRIPASEIVKFMPLAGKQMNIAGNVIQLGIPRVRMIQPTNSLYSRLVIIKGFTEPNGFIEAALRQLRKITEKGKIELVKQAFTADKDINEPRGSRSEFIRRTVQIKDRQIVGFAVKASELSDEDSVLLQQQGLGGRRRLGCGIFMPIRE